MFRQFPPYPLNQDTLSSLTLEGEEIRKRVVDRSQKGKRLGLGAVDGGFDLAWSVSLLSSLFVGGKIAENIVQLFLAKTYQWRLKWGCG